MALSIKVLIVEDEFIIASSIQKILEADPSCNFSCWTVGSGTEAVLKAKECQPTVVLMDIGLPGGVDGVQAASEIRKDSQVPIIFMSGYSDSETRTRVSALAPSAFLVKPFPDSRLKKEIRTLTQNLD